MCGRTACTLDPQSICRLCGKQGTDGSWTQPHWIDPPGGQKYYPSYNLAPSAHSPVLLSKKYASCGPEESCSVVLSEWVIQPMRWGLVPHWHRGDPKSVTYNMNNARSDGILTKTTFKKPLDMGRRCVVLADGYYEWQRSSDGKKQPYFIYFPQPSADDTKPSTDDTKPSTDDIKPSTDDTKPSTDDTKLKLNPAAVKKESCDVNIKVGSGGGELACKKMLTMAGLFDIWRPADGGEPLYSYSVITVDAHASLAWMHDRMPAILNGEDEVRAWLDVEHVPLKDAMELIRPLDCLVNHPVSTAVNDARYKSSDCVKPIDITRVQEKASASSNLMKAWLGTAQKRSGDDLLLSAKKSKN